MVVNASTRKGMFQDYGPYLHYFYLVKSLSTLPRRKSSPPPGTFVKVYGLGDNGGLMEREILSEGLIPQNKPGEFFEIPPSNGVIAVRDLDSKTFVRGGFIRRLQSRHPMLDLTLIVSGKGESLFDSIPIKRPIRTLSGEEVLPETREFLEQRELIWAPGAFSSHIYNRETGEIDDGGPFSSFHTASRMVCIKNPKTKRPYIPQQIGQAILYGSNSVVESAPPVLDYSI